MNRTMHLIAPKKFLRKQKTYCGLSGQGYILKQKGLLKKFSTDITDKPNECLCDACLIKFEVEHLDEVYV